MESKKLKFNIEKTKVLVSGKECKTDAHMWSGFLCLWSRTEHCPLYNMWKINSQALLRTAKCLPRKSLTSFVPPNCPDRGHSTLSDGKRCCGGDGLLWLRGKRFG